MPLLRLPFVHALLFPVLFSLSLPYARAAPPFPDVVVSTFELSAAERFSPDAIGEIRNSRAKSYERGKYQTGEVDGVPYIIDLASLDAKIGLWYVDCDKDAITDKVFCRAHRGDLDIDLHGNGRVIISVGAENFPGSHVTLRIDRGKPISNEPSHSGNP